MKAFGCISNDTMLKAIYAEIVQKDDIVLCRCVGCDDGFLGLLGAAGACALPFRAEAVVVAIRRVAGHGAKAVHLVGWKF